MTVKTDWKKKRIISTNLIGWVTSLFFLIPNLLFIIQGFTNRYWADDYCFSGFIKKYGIFDGLAVFYSTTSNRFSAFIFAGLSELLGSKAIRVIPALVFITLGYILYRLILKYFEMENIAGSKSKSFLLTQILLFFILYLSPNAAQSLYWRSGLTHYFLPIPLMLVLVDSIFFNSTHYKNFILRAVGIFLLACFNAGLSESYAALQLGIFSLLLFFVALRYKFNFRHDQILGIMLVLVGTIAAMLIMIVSPGNALRLDTLDQAPDLLSIVSISFSSTFNFIKFSIRGLWLPFGTLFGLSVFSGFHFIRSESIKLKPSQLLMLWLLIILIIFILIVCVCAPTAYGMMTYPEQRVLMLAHVLLVVGIFFEGCILGLFMQLFGSRYKFLNSLGLILFLLLSLYPLSTIQTRMMDLKEYSERAEMWDIRYSEIQTKITKGETDLIVSAVDSFSEIAELNADPNFWVNQCAAEYYGVQSLSALER